MRDKYIPTVGDFVFGPKNTWWIVDGIDSEDGTVFLIGDDGEDYTLSAREAEGLDFRGENVR